MNEDFDPEVAERFSVLDSITVPDNRPGTNRDGPSVFAGRSHRWMVPITAVACLVALISGLVAVTTVRSDDQTEPVSGVAMSTCEAEGRCAPAQWDAISIEGSVIDFVYYVDAECSGTLLGTQFEETDDAVDISVLVAIDPETECSGEILQRSGSVLLQQPAQDLDGPNPQRELTGCRNPASRVLSPTDAGTETINCRVEITSRFPVYDMTQRRAEYDELLANPPDGVTRKELVSFETDPIDITEPGVYEVTATVDLSQVDDCGGFTAYSELDDFIDYSIDPGDALNELYDKSTGIYEVSMTMEVFEVTYPAEGVFFRIC